MTAGHASEEGAAEVLVVDDEPDVTELYSAWLEREYTVRTAYGPEEALEKASEDTDVVFLDRQMPERSGDEVLEELRARGVDCRVVMVTAVEPDFDIVEMPFDDYLTKPVGMADLRAATEDMLTRESYDRKLQKYFSLASKKATLEARKNPTELRESERYADLESEVETLASATDEFADAMDSRDFESLFREFPDG